MEQKNLKKYAQDLRKNQTKEESLLWYQFLSRYPHRFRRQYVIGNYIADFYCHKAKLVVELDGSQHYGPLEMENDRKRTEYLESQGLKVLRFTNLDIQREFRSACEAIDMTVKERMTSVSTNCGRSFQMSPFLFRLAFGEPPSPRGKVFHIEVN